jgi:hypothetical protein
MYSSSLRWLVYVSADKPEDEADDCEVVLAVQSSGCLYTVP